MRINNPTEFLQAYPHWRAWNHHHTIKNFISVYRFTFTHYTLIHNPFWRIYKIIRHTVSGKYKEIEKEFAEDYKKLLTTSFLCGIINSESEG